MSSRLVRRWAARLVAVTIPLAMGASSLAILSTPAGAAVTTSSTALAASPSSSTYGGSVTLTATVTGATPTGTVDFLNGTTAICTGVSLNVSGQATCTTSSLPAGTLSLIANYAGDNNNSTSTTTISFVVSPATLTVTPVNASVTYGTASPYSYPAPSSYVTGFVLGDSTASTGYVAPTCTFTSYTNTSTVGTTGTINCSGGTLTNYTFNDTATATWSITQATPTSALSSNPAGSPGPQYGTQQILTDTVTGTSTSPTGTVNFMDGGITITGCGTAALTPVASTNTSTATCGPVDFGGGSHSFSAHYSGDTNYSSGTDATMSETVTTDTPTVVLGASPNPATYGASVTLSATVDSVSGGAPPTGSVTFMIGATAVTGCTNPATLTTSGGNGTATCVTTQLPVGSDSLTVSYGGDTNYATATSSAVTEVINQASVTGVITLSAASPIVYGTSETMTLTLTGTATSPTGTVDFLNGTSALCSAVTLTPVASTNTSTATCTTTGLQVPSASINWSYAGDTNYVSSSSSSSTAITVTKYPLTVTPNNQTIVYGSAVPGASFYTFGLSALVNGDSVPGASYVAPTCTSGYTTTSPAGTPITITCSGGSATNYSFDTTATATLNVAKAPEAPLVITSTTGTFGSALTLTTSGGSGTGSISFTLVSSGTAGCSLSVAVLTASSVGTCVVTATKAADTDYLAETTPNTLIQFFGVPTPSPQTPLIITTTSGTAGTGLTLSTSGGSGPGAVTFVLAGPGTANCSLSGAVLTATTAGSCTVTAAKASGGDFLPASSAATTITFVSAPTPTPTPTPRPAPRAIRVVGIVHTGARTEVTIIGVGFFGQPRITSNAGGTRVLVHHDNGRQLVITVIVARNVRKGVHTLTLVFANGKTTRVNYIQR